MTQSLQHLEAVIREYQAHVSALCPLCGRPAEPRGEQDVVYGTVKVYQCNYTDCAQGSFGLTPDSTS